MFRHIFFLFFISVFITISQAQSGWNEISAGSLQLRSYQAFPDADAVILVNDGTLVADIGSEGYEFILERYVRIHILTEKGIEEANRAIYYRSEDKFQNIMSIKGQTVNYENGRIVKSSIKRKEFHKEDMETEGWTAMKFTFPQVKVGSILEFKYGIGQKSAFSYTWHFQDDLPTMSSQFIFYPHPRLSHIFFYQGGFSEKLKRPDNKTWKMQKIPAMVDEPYIPNTNDYRDKVMIQLEAYAYRGNIEKVLSSWEGFTFEMYEDNRFGKFEKKNSLSDAKAISLTDSLEKPKDKARAIYNYLTRSMEWTGKRRLYTERTIDDIFLSQEGSTAEINLVLIRMLRAAGIKATPMFISTRAHGRIIKDYPLLNQFNTMACYAVIDGIPYQLDATDPLRPYNLPPYANLNREGWLLDRDNPRWIPVSNKYPSVRATTVNLDVESDGSLSGNISESMHGYTALRERRFILSEGEDAYIKEQYLEEMPEGEITDLKIENLDNPDEKLQISAKIKTTDFSTVNGAFIYLKPMLTFGIETNSFTASSRYYPIDFAHRVSDEYSVLIAIPEGYEVESIPKSSKVILPDSDMSFTYSCVNLRKAIQVQTKFQIKEPYYLAREYSSIKQMFDEAIERYSDQIVLKKID